MSQIIKFTNINGLTDIFPPEPATKNIPDWYKNLESYTAGDKRPDGRGNTTATIKKCMPVFDMISAGYIIKSQVDVFVSQKEAVDQNDNDLGRIPWYEWPQLTALEFHPIVQAENHPSRNSLNSAASYPKWINTWSVQTPPGYSTLFIQPTHRESVFTIFPGIVDTDIYTAPVNFPFVLNDWSFEGLIPAGTPIAQVIPFKRDDFEMKIGNQEDAVAQIGVITKLRTRIFDSYKNQFRQQKSYK